MKLNLKNCHYKNAQTLNLILLAFAFILGSDQIASAQITYALTNVWYVSANAIAVSNIITTGDQNRSLAYDLNSNQVFVVAKAGAAPAPGIEVLDAANGNVLGFLDKAVVSTGTFLLNQVKVAGDGAIYSANLATVTASAPLKIYRWTNWLSTATVAYSGNALSNTVSGYTTPTAAGQRMGDSMAITGSGVNTMILMPVGTGSPTISTNAVLFTTTDGINFTNHILNISGFTAAGNAICGVSFYTNNTFLIRTSGSAGNNVFLIQFPANIASLDSGPITATQIGAFAVPSVVSSTAFIDYKAAGQGGLMALASPQSSGGASAVGQVALYSDPVVGSGGCPILQASTNYPHLTTDGNLAGGVALGGNGFTNFIFSLDCNNGVRCSAITIVPSQAPSISSQPVGGTVYPPYAMTVSASGFCPLSYQWQITNNAGAFTDIPGANSSSYTVSSPSSNYYRVVITNSVNPAATSVAVLVNALTPITNSSVAQLWRVSAGQSGYNYITSTSDDTRGIAYDTNSQRLVVASIVGGNGLYILDANTGTNIGILNLTGATLNGTKAFDQVGIADDGVVYSGNLAVGGQNFNLNRWSTPATTASAISSYTGDPGAGSNDRWGDSMAVRGAGANTQILLGSKATNVALLTTADGTNFTAKLITITNATSGFTGNGVAFGSGNTFWAKSSGGDLWEIAFDPISQIGGKVFDFAQPGQIPGSMVGVGVDTSLNILAGINLSNNPDDLELFQLTGTSDGPVLFQQSFFASNNGNGNANAAIAMKNGRIYALDVNNGILALNYTTPYGTPPVIVTPPGDQTVYTNISAVTLSVSSSGTFPFTYQWRYNSNNIAGANSQSYSISNPPVSASGYYDVIVHNVSGMVTSTPPALLTVLTPTTSTVVTQLWTIAAGSRSYLDGTSYSTRGLAYDTNTADLLVADHFNIHVLSGTNGGDLFDMNVLGLSPGLNGWTVDQVGVADDGVVYACNLSADGLGFAITGWSAVSSGASLFAAFAQSDQLASLSPGDRWGDTMTVRGSGLNTQILLGSYNGTNVILFTTTDGSTFTPTVIAVQDNVPLGFAGLGIAFGSGDTFWAKGGHNYNLRQVSFNAVAGTGNVVQLFTAGSQVPNDLTGLGVDTEKNILAGVCFNNTPNDLQLYQISGNTNPPYLFDQIFFASNNPNSQENAVTVIKGGLAFGLDINNGLVALSYGTPPPPLTAYTITSISAQTGSSVVLVWQSISGHTYQVQYKNSLSDLSWFNAGSSITAISATASITNDVTGTNTRFYRIQGQ